MSLTELMPAIQALSRWDKLRLINLIVGELAHEEMRTPKPAAPGDATAPTAAGRLPVLTELPRPKRERRYPGEEICRRGAEIYERDIKPTLKPEDDGKYVSIDMETGMYEIDADERAAGDRLYARRPEAQVFSRRIGYRLVTTMRPNMKYVRESEA